VARGLDTSYVGVDVGAKRLHAVAIDRQGTVNDVRTLASDEADVLVASCAGASAVAIDAPSTLSRAPHAEAMLSRKFQRARCAEIALGRLYGIWVPWVTPEAEPPAWMAVGIDLFRRLGEAGVPALEVYPYAGFRVLAGGRLAPKSSLEGLRQRAALLAVAGLEPSHVEAWSHDALDALLAAAIARDWALGRAREVTCGHDGSAIWLPGEPRGGL
jgi:predicted nuclease with RNAse H fold